MKNFGKAPSVDMVVRANPTEGRIPDALLEKRSVKNHLELLVLKKGMLVQEFEVHKTEAWAFGTVLFDPNPNNEEPPPSNDPLITYSYDTGWFPSKFVEKAHREQLAKLAVKVDALKTPKGWEVQKDSMHAQLFPVKGDRKNYAEKEFRKMLDGGPNGQYSRVKAVESYTARNDRELSMQEGDTFLVYETKGHRMKVKAIGGDIGLVPSKSVERFQFVTNVISIERIQNKSMWQSYAVKKQGMVSQKIPDPEKKWLFHGTSGGSVEPIIQQGFNRVFSGKNAALHGKGVYFAKYSGYSADPEFSPPDEHGVQSIFLCRILVGHACKGTEDAVVPDVKDAAKNILFDSTTDKAGDAATIFVTYHDAQQYPEYLIKFKQTMP
jgi:poly [ADP-ribose] polymerase 10/14/15